MTAPELFQFNFSHYNEKVRWALDYKRVPHVRHSLLPGPHLLSVTRLSGQKQVPVLRLDGEVVAGSSRIIDRLEHIYPDPPLYPKDSGERERALEIQRWFDEQVGAEIRRAMFFEILPDAKFSTRLFANGRGAFAQGLYRGVFPAIRIVMKKDMQIDAAGAGRGIERTREALDFIVENAGPEGYLAGSTFSVADLTAASILFPAVLPAELQFQQPERAKVMENWLARWAEHPGAAWVRDMYRRHRGTSAEIRGQ